jgi:hypothetical protein
LDHSIAKSPLNPSRNRAAKLEQLALETPETRLNGIVVTGIVVMVTDLVSPRKAGCGVKIRHRHRNYYPALQAPLLFA